MSSTGSRDERGRFDNIHPDRKGSRGRAKKRPRCFSKDNSTEPKRSRTSTSARKLQGQSSSDTYSNTQNRVIDINILFSELQKVLCCNKCHGPILLSESNIQGLGFKINIDCDTCAKIASINSSKKVGLMSNAWEVNRRSALAMRALGHGHSGLLTFCGIMDLPTPVAHSALDNINKHLSEVCEEVAQEAMNAAVKEEISATPSDQIGLTVSGDGSWRKRGFSSLQGITSIIGNKTGKVLDVDAKNSFCKPCAKWEDKEKSAEYEEWFEQHAPDCTANHQGSAGKMEVDSICAMFQRSVDKYGVMYQYYIGDGDSKVFKAVTETKPYGEELLIEKKECIAHVQKRMGTRLRNLKKSLAKQTLADGKGIGGKGRLTGQVIGVLSSYYGKAIRQNSGSVPDMRNAIWATFYHKMSTDERPQHDLCPKGPRSWCKWQKAKAQNQLNEFSHKSSIPSAIMEQLRPIYEDLSEPELLRRCLGGFTQNCNESFNNCVWKLVPKISFSGFTVLKIGLSIAVTCFNSGRSGFLKIMDKFDCKPGENAFKWMQATDEFRLVSAEKKMQASTKEARTLRRRAQDQVPDDSYAAGAY